MTDRADGRVSLPQREPSYGTLEGRDEEVEDASGRAALAVCASTVGAAAVLRSGTYGEAAGFAYSESQSS